MNAALHVAIIGAGICGLSCAQTLQRAGLQATVFDKSRGLAGRMSTRRVDDWQCDHGAQYFTARDPDFRAEVQRWIDAGAAALWAPRLHVLGDQSQHAPEESLQRFVGLPRMTAPARLMAQSLEVRTQMTITQLERRAGGWQLRSAESGWLDRPFDAALLAVPAPQAMPLLQGPAPALASVAAGARMRGCWAAMLRYGAPLSLPFDAAFVNAGPLRWIARDSSKPGRSGPETWLLHASSDWSEAHLEEDAEAIAAKLLRAFADLGGAPPLAITAHRWRYADTEPPLARGCAWDVEHGLGLCGDWLNGGRVEGAWCSGRLLARRVLHALVRSDAYADRFGTGANAAP